MSATVSCLVARGVVTKEPHPGDARASVVTLTAEGRAELDRTRAGNGTVVARHATDAGLDAARVGAAVEVLRRLLDPSSDHPEGTP